MNEHLLSDQRIFSLFSVKFSLMNQMKMMKMIAKVNVLLLVHFCGI